MDYVKKVNNLSLTGDLNENWRKFKQNYDIFEEAAGIQTQSENKRIASFLNTIGEEALELFNTFEMSPKDRKCYAKIRNAFEKHCTTKKRTVLQRFKFFSRRQTETDTLKSFLADLTKMAASCEFKDQEKSLIRDQFLLGVNDKAMQAEMLLFEDNLNFDKIVELLELLAVAHNYQRKDRAADDDVIVNGEPLPVHQLTVNGSVGQAPKSQEDKKPRFDQIYDDRMCKRCNYRHKYGDCPAFGKKCLKCFESNHFAVCCTVKTDDYKKPCKRCNQKHPYRECPAFGKRCQRCFQMNHFSVNCGK